MTSPHSPDLSAVRDRLSDKIETQQSEITTLRSQVTLLTEALVDLNGAIDDYWNGSHHDAAVKRITAMQGKARAVLEQIKKEGGK